MTYLYDYILPYKAFSYKRKTSTLGAVLGFGTNSSTSAKELQKTLFIAFHLQDTGNSLEQKMIHERTRIVLKMALFKKKSIMNL